jgi:hypothetical protein
VNIAILDDYFESVRASARRAAPGARIHRCGIPLRDFS